MDVYYSLRVTQKFVAYAPKVDKIFLYWCEDDILHCLGELGHYQVCFVDEVSDDAFVELGEF